VIRKNNGAKAFDNLLRAGIIVTSILFLTLAITTIVLALVTADKGRYQDIPTPTCETQLSLPLPRNVIADLCNRNLVPGDLGQCSVEIPQLRRDDTASIFKARIELNVTPYQLVEKDFGRYEISCSKTNSFGNYYTCDYNLSGEGPIVTISFDATTQVAKNLSILIIGC